jgi:hypothetical protein
MTAPNRASKRILEEETMDEEHKGGEPEVEAHTRRGVNIEPAAEADDENEVEAHVRKATMRMDSPSRS